MESGQFLLEIDNFFVIFDGGQQVYNKTKNI